MQISIFRNFTFSGCKMGFLDFSSLTFSLITFKMLRPSCYRQNFTKNASCSFNFSVHFSHEVLKFFRLYRLNVNIKSALPSRFSFNQKFALSSFCKPCCSNKMTEFQSFMPCMIFSTKKLENKHVVFFFRHNPISSGISRGVLNLKKSKKNWLLVKLKICDL